AEMVKRSKVPEQDGRQDAQEMIRLMSAAQKTISDTIAGVASYADGMGDVATHDLLIGRQITHEKFAWILDAHLA
ncbi:MAG: ferritin-like domain-containing protein, partial [Pseudomonadota bacterium]